MKVFKTFLEEKGKTMDELSKMSAEDQAGLYNEFNAQNTEAFKAMSDDLTTTKEDIKKSQDAMIAIQAEQNKQLNKALEEVGLKLTALEEGKKSSITSNKSIIEQLQENKVELENMAKGGRGSFTIKVAGDMTLAGNVTGQVPQAERILGLNTIASRQVRLLDIVSTGTIGSNLVEWVYQANKDGAAGATAEGAAKNQIDFDLVVGSQKVEKITAYIKATTEMLADNSWIEQEIRNELMRELLKAVEQGAYSGSGVSPILLGYRTVSPSFTGGTAAGGVDNANEVDVLAAAVLQIEEADQPMPNYHMVHPSTLYFIKSLKVSTSDRRYVEYNNRIQFDNAGMVSLDGIPILSTTLVTAGEFLTGYFEYAKLLTREGVSITIGLDSDDFTKNFRTILAEWRGVSFIKHNDRTAFVKGVFATAKTALETT